MINPTNSMNSFDFVFGTKELYFPDSGLLLVCFIIPATAFSLYSILGCYFDSQLDGSIFHGYGVLLRTYCSRPYRTSFRFRSALIALVSLSSTATSATPLCRIPAHAR